MRIRNIYNLLGPVILLCGAITAPVHSAGESVNLGAVDIQGDFVQGGLVLGMTSAGSTVVYDGQEIRVSDWFSSRRANNSASSDYLARWWASIQIT
jgi:hypothetical protein